MGTQAPPKPTAAAAPANEIPLVDLLQLVTDETERRQLQQQLLDERSAGRMAAALGTPAAQIELKIKYGRAYGFNEVQSEEWIYLMPVKNGALKPLIDYKGRAFLLKRAGYDWRPVNEVSWTSEKAHFVFYKDGAPMVDGEGKPLTLCWTIKDAEKAGLVARARSKPTDPDGTYDKFPKRMLFAKVIHDFGAAFAQEVTGAGHPDKFDAPTLEEVVNATEQMRMPEEATDAHSA